MPHGAPCLVTLCSTTKPEDWLHYTLVDRGQKLPLESNRIARFNAFSNTLADWYAMHYWLIWTVLTWLWCCLPHRVISLILSHDKPKGRVRQIQKFAEVAQCLRNLNNYSALRAIIAGIHNTTFAGDAAWEGFRTSSPGLFKAFQSWDTLLKAQGSHRLYRIALGNSEGVCIPALCVFPFTTIYDSILTIWFVTGRCIS